MGCDQSKSSSSSDVDAKTKVRAKVIETTVACISTGALLGLRTNPDDRLKVRRLTEYQVDIIHSTWPLLSSDITATGTSIFVDIFANEPAVKKLFPYMA
jgi:hypothetical protein